MENIHTLDDAINALGSLKIGTVASPVKICLACGKSGAKSLCMGCRSVSFCGKACQKVAWPGHKKECRRIVREKALEDVVAAYEGLAAAPLVEVFVYGKDQEVAAEEPAALEFCARPAGPVRD